MRHVASQHKLHLFMVRSRWRGRKACTCFASQSAELQQAGCSLLPPPRVTLSQTGLRGPEFGTLALRAGVRGHALRAWLGRAL